MRQTYHIRLHALQVQGAPLCQLAGECLRKGTESLLSANLHLAEEVIGAGDQLEQMRIDAERVAMELLALQAPVASDLRTVVSALWIVADLQRMGELAIHIAKVARRRFPSNAVPPRLRPIIREMGVVGARAAEAAQTILQHRDVTLARTLPDIDRQMDELQERIFAEVNAPTWADGVASAVDAALLGRFYERFGDHAVAVARRTIFLVTGENIGGATILTSPGP